MNNIEKLGYSFFLNDAHVNGDDEIVKFLHENRISHNIRKVNVKYVNKTRTFDCILSIDEFDDAISFSLKFL